MAELFEGSYLFTIIIGSFIAFIPKVIPAACISFLKFNSFAKRFLNLIPYTALTAMCFPAVFTAIDNNIYYSTAGCLFAIILALRGVNLSLIILFTVAFMVTILSLF